MTDPAKREFKYELAGLGMLALSFLTAASFIFTPSVGKIGQFLSYILGVATGSGKVILPVIFALSGIHFLARRSFKPTFRTAGVLILFLTLLIYLHIQVPPGEVFSAAARGAGGGFIGALPAYVLLPSFGRIGTYIVLVTLVVAGITCITGSSTVDIVKKLYYAVLSGGKWLSRRFTAIKEKKKKSIPRRERGANKKNPKQQKNTDSGKPSPGKKEPRPVPAENSIDHGTEVNGQEKEQAGAGTEENGGIVLENPPALNSHFSLPPTGMLQAPVEENVDDSAIQERSELLENILANFGIKAEVTNVSVGPAITRYEIKPPPGIKVSRISALADDIALGMAASGVRIEAPIPKKAAVGIEVPNPEINPVQLRELLESSKFSATASRLSVALGKDIAGNPVIADLGKMPHLLIAGATGAGKSVCVNTLICSILFNATPDEVKFILIDPKMVELANYNGIPHLVSPVVTDPKKAAGALRWVVKEMERRYELFASTGARDITRYNQLCRQKMELQAEEMAGASNGEPPAREAAESEEMERQAAPAADGNAVQFKSPELGEEEGESTPAPLPYIVVIIDELSDLMMVAPGDVEDAICRLAQMARACGIHLVVATQRPSVDVITGLIKANIPSRISFAVSSQTDSRTILDSGGAEKLLGKGDMLYHPVGAPKPLRVQGAFLDDEEVETVVDYLKQQAQPEYNEEVTEEPLESTGENNEDWDDLLPQSAQLFIESGNASISMLQRRLHIGYSRAARLMDIMERRGIVGGYEGSKPRQVLMTWEQYMQVFGDKQAQAN